MSVGQMREFVLKSGNWSAYVERMEMYFLVNKVANELKLPTLISAMGDDAYELLSTLASPSRPSELTYNRAVELMAAHLQPKPSVLAERYKFRQRRQLSESIADYVTELKKLSKYCEFGSSLDENLRDQLVCGLKSETIRQRLFSEEKLEYKRAVSLALSLEAAERDAIAVERGNIEMSVHKLNVGESPRCGDRRHQARDCVYKDYECSWCHVVGHLRRRCPKKESKMGSDCSTGQRRASRAEDASGSDYQTRTASSYSSSRGGRGFSRGWNARGRRAARGQRDAGRGSSLYQIGEHNPIVDSKDEINDYQCNIDDEEPMYQMSLRN